MTATHKPEDRVERITANQVSINRRDGSVLAVKERSLSKYAGEI